MARALEANGGSARAPMTTAAKAAAVQPPRRRGNRGGAEVDRREEGDRDEGDAGEEGRAGKADRGEDGRQRPRRRRPRRPRSSAGRAAKRADEADRGEDGCGDQRRRHRRRGVETASRGRVVDAVVVRACLAPGPCPGGVRHYRLTGGDRPGRDLVWRAAAPRQLGAAVAAGCRANDGAVSWSDRRYIPGRRSRQPEPASGRSRVYWQRWVGMRGFGMDREISREDSDTTEERIGRPRRRTVLLGVGGVGTVAAIAACGSTSGGASGSGGSGSGGSGNGGTRHQRRRISARLRRSQSAAGGSSRTSSW